MEFSRAFVVLIMVFCSLAVSCINSRMVVRCLIVLALEEEVEDVRAAVKLANTSSIFSNALERAA